MLNTESINSHFLSITDTELERGNERETDLPQCRGIDLPFIAYAFIYERATAIFFHIHTYERSSQEFIRFICTFNVILHSLLRPIMPALRVCDAARAALEDFTDDISL